MKELKAEWADQDKLKGMESASADVRSHSYIYLHMTKLHKENVQKEWAAAFSSALKHILRNSKLDYAIAIHYTCLIQ